MRFAGAEMEPEGRLPPGEPSAAVQAAQALLWQLREERGIRPGAPRELPWEQGDAYLTAPNWLLINAQSELHGRRQKARGANLPSHSFILKDTQPSSSKLIVRTDNPSALDPKIITVHPTILLSMLKQHLEAPGRVWLLLRAIDRDGRGWLSVEDARQRLTGKCSPYHICGWRRLRQLLAQGEGVFWHRDAKARSAGPDRLWLFGAHRIAYKLDSGRLQGFPVELPISALLGGIQAVRAAFYATFHGGRDSKPISRETLESISGIPGRTQLEYDRVARVERRRNIAIGERHTAENAQERAWRHGRAAFHFIDTEGWQGRAGREYVAWHLPNSYRADYQRRSRGSRKRLNRKLADLVKKGIPGNDDRAVEKLFFSTGALAAKRYNRCSERDAYWQQQERTRAGGGLWHVMPGASQ